MLKRRRAGHKLFDKELEQLTPVEHGTVSQYMSRSKWQRILNRLLAFLPYVYVSLRAACATFGALILLALLGIWDVPMAVSVLLPILCGVGAISAKVGLAKKAR